MTLRPNARESSRRAATCLLVVAALSGAGRAWGWTPGGNAVAPSDSSQFDPVIVADSVRGAYVVWQNHEASYRSSTRAQRLTDRGTAPGWPSSGIRLPVPELIFWGRTRPVAIPDGRGGMFAADDGYYESSVVQVNHLDVDGGSGQGWPSQGVEIDGLTLAQSTEEPTSPEETQSPPFGNYYPNLTLDGGGWFFVDFERLTPCCNWVGIRRIGLNGEGAPGWPARGVNLGFGRRIATCPDGQDGAFVAHYAYVGHYVVTVKHVTSAGVVDPAWPAGGRVVSGVCGEGPSSSLVPDGSGGCIAVWHDERADGSRLVAQRVLPNGAIHSAWPEGGRVVCKYPTAPGFLRDGLASGKRRPALTPDGTGGLFTTWTDYRDSTGTGHGDIYAQHLLPDATLAPGWPEDGAPVCRVAGDQSRPSLSPDGLSGLFVTWQDSRGRDRDIYVQHLNPAGAPATGWPEHGFSVCAMPGDQETPVVTASGSEAAIVAWSDRRGPVPNIYAALASPDAIVPVLVSLERADATPKSAQLRWSTRAGERREWQVFRRTSSEGWLSKGRAESGSDGAVTFEDRDVVPGARYGYAIASDASNGLLGETWLDIPHLDAFELEPIVPNPAGRGPLSVGFRLPVEARVLVELLDVRGRVLIRREHAAAIGRQVIELVPARALPAGVYLVRVRAGERSAMRRFSVAR